MVYAPQPIWLDAIARILEGEGVSVVGKATTRDGCACLVRENSPDLLVSDASADSSVDDLELVKVCRAAVPEIRVLLLAASTDTESIDAALRAGVSAYIFKTAHPRDVSAAIRHAFQQSVYVTEHAAAPQNSPIDPRAAALSAGLTQRESEILALIAEGHSNAKAAQLLHVTEQTVKFHLSNIYRKLSVRNRTEASAWAHTHGLVVASSGRILNREG